MPSALEDIRRAARIEDIIGEYVELKGRGRKLTGLCHFHQEKTASLSVDTEQGLWYCFGCGAGGDVFSWLMRAENLSFQEAARYLAERYRIVMPEWTEEEQRNHERQMKATELLGAVAFALSERFAGSPAEKYLAGRGIPAEVAAKYRVGYCPDPSVVSAVVNTADVTKAVVEESGLFKGRSIVWEERVVVPITERGRVVNFYTRAIADVADEDKHRYLAERPRPGWNLDGRAHGNPTVVAEGAIDGLALATAGFEAPVAVLGSSAKGAAERFAERLAGLERVVVAMDADDESNNRAGQVAALDLAIELGKLGVRADMCDLTDGEDHRAPTDPAAVLQAYGPDRLREQVGAASSPWQFRKRWGLKVERSLIEIDGSAHKLRYDEREYVVLSIDELTDPKGNKVRLECRSVEGEMLEKDSLLLISAARRRQFANAMARAVGVPREEADEFKFTVARELLDLDTELRMFLAETLHLEEDQVSPAYEMTDREKEEALEFLRSPRLFQTIVEDAQFLGVVGERLLITILYLVMTSRLTDEPLFCCIKGESSAGKSYTAGIVASLCPKEDLREFSRVTAQALYHVESDYLKHKLLLMREHVGGEAADYSIRTMLSESGLELLSSVKGKDEKWTSENVTVEGPLAYVETTTEIELNPENETRLVEVWPDESEGQTLAIHDYQRMLSTEEGLREEPQRFATIRKHQNAQRLLDGDLRVVIPYAKLLVFPYTLTRHRRDNDKFLRLIRIVAFLHQYRKVARTVTATGGQTMQVIDADVEDYEVAYRLARPLFGRTLDELDKRGRELLLKIYDIAKGVIARENPTLTDEPDPEAVMRVSLTRREITNKIGKGKGIVKHLEMLAEGEFLVRTAERGKPIRYSLASGDPERPGDIMLLTPEELARKLENSHNEEGTG